MPLSIVRVGSEIAKSLSDVQLGGNGRDEDSKRCAEIPQKMRMNSCRWPSRKVSFVGWSESIPVSSSNLLRRPPIGRHEAAPVTDPCAVEPA